MTTEQLEELPASGRVTVDLLRHFIDINLSDGSMRWKHRHRHHFKSDVSFKGWNTRYAGKPTFKSTDGRGYLRASIQDKDYKAHIVAWALYHSEWPRGEVDHINGNKKDNSLNNLRLATSSQNKMNVSPRIGGSSSHKGVCWVSTRGKWEARITANGKTLRLGYFDDENEAARAYKNAATDLHGEFRNYG